MMTIAQTEVVETLAHVRGSFERQLAGTGCYRALRNIEDTLVDVMDDEALVQPLNGVRDLLILRLQECPDFRALRTIDVIVPQLLEVLSLHAQQADGPADSDGASTFDDAGEATEVTLVQDPQQAEVSQPVAAAEGGDAPVTEQTSMPSNGHTAFDADADALSPITPQSFGLAVIVPAEPVETKDITNEPVDEQTSGAPHRLDADDAREEERAA